MTATEALAAEMRRIVAAEPTAPLANVTRQIGPLYIRLYRHGQDWTLSLQNDAPIPEETRTAWGAAVGAPAEAEWRHTARYMSCLLEWVDVGEDAPEVRGAAMWGGRA